MAVIFIGRSDGPHVILGFAASCGARKICAFRLIFRPLRQLLLALSATGGASQNLPKAGACFVRLTCVKICHSNKKAEQIFACSAFLVGVTGLEPTASSASPPLAVPEKSALFA